MRRFVVKRIQIVLGALAIVVTSFAAISGPALAEDLNCRDARGDLIRCDGEFYSPYDNDNEYFYDDDSFYDDDYYLNDDYFFNPSSTRITTTMVASTTTPTVARARSVSSTSSF
jgi:hypothetical protein